MAVVFTLFFYPRCKGFVIKSSRERAYSYSIYDTARLLFPDVKTTFSLAKEIAIYIYYFHNTKETYLLDLYGYCSDQSKLYELSQYFYDSDVLLHSFNSDEFSRYVHRIYTELLISKHFLYFVCTHNTFSGA